MVDRRTLDNASSRLFLHLLETKTIFGMDDAALFAIESSRNLTRAANASHPMNGWYRLMWYRSSQACHWTLRVKRLLTSWVVLISIYHFRQPLKCLNIACRTSSSLVTATTNRLRVRLWAVRYLGSSPKPSCNGLKG